MFPRKMEERKIYTLRQVGNAIKQRIEEATHGASFWVKAEIASINVGKHAYLELVQHQAGEKVAVMRGAIWMSALHRIREELGSESRNILKDGVEILFLAKTNYHLVHGLSLVIETIDLSFNISELERRKRETIATLKEEGLYDRNRFIPMPMVLQRIALVASVGTAAYADFMQHLERNEHGYRFHVRMFNSVVQGDAAAQELRAALSRSIQTIRCRGADQMAAAPSWTSNLLTTWNWHAWRHEYASPCSPALGTMWTSP
ncbi:MAG: exodeoxyribonuclease VII large subunit [Flavobacteriales bacterium]|nr:exodeoxyribonuclease VII large subunit [Flavobacteriales bacterium]